VATRIYVRIYDSRIKALNAQGKPVGRYIHRKGDTVQRYATQNAPKRSGRLARSVHLGNQTWRGHRASIEIEATAPYAKYVHNGTYGPIYPVHSLFLSVPVAPSITGVKMRRTLRPYVAGQHPQPFLREAAAFVMSGSRFIRTFGSGNV
jgi:hypothetical protein